MSLEVHRGSFSQAPPANWFRLRRSNTNTLRVSALCKAQMDLMNQIWFISSGDARNVPKKWNEGKCALLGRIFQGSTNYRLERGHAGNEKRGKVTSRQFECLIETDDVNWNCWHEKLFVGFFCFCFLYFGSLVFLDPHREHFQRHTALFTPFKLLITLGSGASPAVTGFSFGGWPRPPQP